MRTPQCVLPALAGRRPRGQTVIASAAGLGGLLASVVVLGSCTQPVTAVSAVPGFPGVAVRLQDDFGRPAALGAKLVVHDGAYVDSATGYSDPWTVGAADNRAGTYTLVVTRPWYDSVVLSKVDVPGGSCGAYQTVTVSSIVHLAPGAPPVRNVVVMPHGAGLGLAGLTLEYSAYVDANPGVDTTVTWSISDTTVARISPSGKLVSQCRTHWGEATVVATSTVDTTVKGTGDLTVFANAASCP